MPIIDVDPQLCTCCGACLALCTGQVYEESGGRAVTVAPEGCWLCGHCVAACPADAIHHSEYPIEECPALDHRALPSLDPLVIAFRERRSARVFRDLPLPRDLVRELVDIALLSGKAVDALAVAAVGEESESAEEFASLAQMRAEGNDPIFFRAPVVLVAHVPADDDFGRDDAVYAAYNLMLAAQRKRLGTCQIGYFHLALDRSRELYESLGLPNDRRPEVTLVLGHPVYDFHRVLPRRRPTITWKTQ